MTQKAVPLVVGYFDTSTAEFMGGSGSGHHLSENHLKHWVVQLQYLSFLSVSHNKLTNITATIKILMHCNSLEVAILGNKFLKESMPNNVSMIDTDGFQNLRFLGLSFYSRLVVSPPRLSVILLQDNLLSGYSDLSHNKLTGTIPTQILELTDLEYLDLSENHLYGEIPVSLISLHFLRQFSIANNNLHGAIPVGTPTPDF
ncbi:receptor-like protein 3 [Carya illinoinensis]|uniref:receptor-like protein 3 n=1 Tax=Carya illinoinensis TaxID=32201 RepID=UPI001C71B504|nr:receptor-like protein 3 [Carya illinoinensis]